MNNQLFDNGSVIEVGGNELECTGVSYQENPETQERHSFSYSFRLKSELDAERKAVEEAEQAANPDTEAVETPTEPEFKEETLNVR